MNDWLTAVAEYHHRATRHRPDNPADLGAEVRRLAASGLKPRDIASALGISVPEVVGMLWRGSGHA